MWIFTKVGFFSIVSDESSPENVLVRARCKEDIDQFAEVAERVAGQKLIATKTPTNDYLYRLSVPRSVCSRTVGRLMWEIDYPQFKNKVRGDPDRDRAYLQCWQAMTMFQTAKDRGGKQ